MVCYLEYFRISLLPMQMFTIMIQGNFIYIILHLCTVNRHAAEFEQPAFKPTMMTPSNGNIFSVIGHLCGEFTGPRWIPALRPVTRSFAVFFDPHPNKRLSKQWRGWWFETLLCLSWRHRNDHLFSSIIEDNCSVGQYKKFLKRHLIFHDIYLDWPLEDVIIHLTWTQFWTDVLAVSFFIAVFSFIKPHMEWVSSSSK